MSRVELPEPVGFIAPTGQAVTGEWVRKAGIDATGWRPLNTADQLIAFGETCDRNGFERGYKAAQADARAEEAAGGVVGWRTMESAPRDGSWILLYDAGHKNPYLHAQFRRGAWWGQLTQSGRAVVWNDPRHWQPLPAPPTAALNPKDSPNG